MLIKKLSGSSQHADSTDVISFLKLFSLIPNSYLKSNLHIHSVSGNRISEKSIENEQLSRKFPGRTQEAYQVSIMTTGYVSKLRVFEYK